MTEKTKNPKCKLAFLARRRKNGFLSYFGFSFSFSYLSGLNFSKGKGPTKTRDQENPDRNPDDEKEHGKNGFSSCARGLCLGSLCLAIMVSLYYDRQVRHETQRPNPFSRKNFFLKRRDPRYIAPPFFYYFGGARSSLGSYRLFLSPVFWLSFYLFRLILPKEKEAKGKIKRKETKNQGKDYTIMGKSAP